MLFSESIASGVVFLDVGFFIVSCMLKQCFNHVSCMGETIKLTSNHLTTFFLGKQLGLTEVQTIDTVQSMSNLVFKLNKSGSHLTLGTSQEAF